MLVIAVKAAVFVIPAQAANVPFDQGPFGQRTAGLEALRDCAEDTYVKLFLVIPEQAAVFVIPAQAGIHFNQQWTPASAGVTSGSDAGRWCASMPV